MLLDALRSVEQEPSLFGITSHLLTVAVVKGRGRVLINSGLRSLRPAVPMRLHRNHGTF